MRLQVCQNIDMRSNRHMAVSSLCCVFIEWHKGLHSVTSMYSKHLENKIHLGLSMNDLDTSTLR